MNVSLPGPQWTGLRARWGARPFNSDLRRRLDRYLLSLALADLQRDETVVDLGAGSGFLSLALAQHLPTGRVIAVDVSADMLQRLEQAARRRGLEQRIQIHHAPAEQTQLPDRSAQRLVSSHMIHELADPGAAFAEMARLLAPGGRLVLCDYWDSPVMGRFIRWMHRHQTCGPQNIAQLQHLLAQAGLTHIVVEKGPWRCWARATKPQAPDLDC